MKLIGLNSYFQTYNALAASNIDAYLKHSQLNLGVKEQQKLIDDVFKLCVKLLEAKASSITPDSITMVKKKLSKDFEVREVQIKLLELILYVIESELNFTTPPIGHFYQIKQEQPKITPDILVNSRLHKSMYELLEKEEVIKAYLSSPMDNIGIVCLWLFLKEGINQLEPIKQIVLGKADLYTIDEHWFVEVKEKRFWLSPKAELLLSAIKVSSSEIKSINPIKVINDVLLQHHIINSTRRISLSELRDALRVEYILTSGPIEFGLSSYSHKTTHLPKESLIRLVTGKRVETDDINLSVLHSTVRQKRSWKTNFTSSSFKNSENYQQITAKEQLKLIDNYVGQLEKLPRKKALYRSKNLRDSLRVYLEDEKQATQHPWCWLILSWLYQLLDKGGKLKSILKLNTIKAYVNYVAGPFIIEFAGCNVSKITPIEWAEKLNLVAEKIQAPKKKGYLIYFAEYLIDNNFAPGLCLSDLDIPIKGATVSANIITVKEADLICEELDNLDAAKSAQSKLIFKFGFYSGLRRGEIQGLQFKDFHANADLSYFNLHIRPNAYRDLKTKASSRNLPLDALWSLKDRLELKTYLEKTKTKFVKRTTTIFSDIKELDYLFDVVTKTIQGVTGDTNLRFHHCRHSFCNWTWVRINKQTFKNNEPYPFLNDDYFTNENCTYLMKRLELTQFTRKKLWVLANLLGHASPDSTISSYLHLVEFIRRVKFANHHPSMSELRFFWGQRLTVNNWSHVKITPRLSELSLTVTPSSAEFIINEKQFNVSEHSAPSDSQMLLQQKVSMVEMWRIIRRCAEGHTVEEISDALNVDAGLIARIIEIDTDLLGRKNSQTKLSPLLDYQKLTKGNIKLLENLIIRFNNADVQGLLAACKLQHITNIVKESLVMAKGQLIRTSDHTAVLSIIELLKIIGFHRKNIKLDWYFPMIEGLNSEIIGAYLIKYHNFKTALYKYYVEEGLECHCVVPKALKTSFEVYEKSANAKIINLDLVNEIKFTDEGRYLPLRQDGFISVHLLQHIKKGEDRRRSKSFISFLRLVTIYHELKTETL